jgi:hypothetical protein
MELTKVSISEKKGTLLGTKLLYDLMCMMANVEYRVYMRSDCAKVYSQEVNEGIELSIDGKAVLEETNTILATLDGNSETAFGCMAVDDFPELSEIEMDAICSSIELTDDGIEVVLSELFDD